MRRAVIAWALAVVGLALNGTAAAWLPRGWLPDPALLGAVVLGLRVGGPAGLVGAWAIGWTADLMSGGPLGEYALLELLGWGITQLSARRVSLERTPVFAAFVFALCASQTLALGALGSAPPLGAETLAVGLPHALVNALAAIVARAVFDEASERLSGGDASARSSLRIDAGAGLR